MLWKAGLGFFGDFVTSCDDIFYRNLWANVNIHILGNFTALSFIISRTQYSLPTRETKKVKLWEIYISHIPFL